MVKGSLAYLLILLISLTFPAQIVSQKVYTDEEGKVYAEGEVEASYRGVYIRADKVKYDPKTKEVFAYGNVYIKTEDGKLEVRAKEAYLNLKTKRGYMISAEGRFEGFYFSADRVDKEGEHLYRIRDGSVTTCPPERRELYVCFSRAKVSDKYVTSFNNSLRFFRVPILYSPFVMFPVGERRTGFLPPMIGSNSYNTFIYIQPFFWAISRDKDATFTLDFRDNQAKGIRAEYRQAFTLKDRIFAELSFYKEPYPPGEWWRGRPTETYRQNRFRAQLSFRRGNWRFALDLPSDPYFFEDVYFSQRKRTTPFTLSYITYSRMDREYYLSLNARAFYDLTSPNNERTVHMLPELGFYMRPKQAGPFHVGLTTSFTNFQSEGDLGTKRLIFHPQAETSLKLLGRTSYLQLKWINNFYYSGGEDTDDRVSTLYGEYRVPFFFDFSLKGSDFSNSVEVVYSFLPEDFNNPRFDNFDEVNKQNKVSLRYTSSLLYASRTVATLFVEGGYDFLGSYRFPTENVRVSSGLQPIRAILSLYPSENVTFSQDATYDAYLGVLARSVTSGSLKLKKMKLRASYVVSRDREKKRLSDQYSLGADLNIFFTVLGGSVTYDNLADKELYRRVYLGVKGGCWSLTADFRRTYYGEEKGYLNEVYLVFNIFNLRDFEIPFRRR